MQTIPMEVDNFLWIYISPWILLMGLVGNTLVLVVMRRRTMRGSSTCVYLVCLSIFDTLALLSGLIPELSWALQLPLFNTISPATCRIEKFFFYTTSDTAIWVLVAFTFDRFVAVCFPLRKKSFCVPRRSKIICLVIFFISVIKNLHVFWTRTVIYQVDVDLLEFYNQHSITIPPPSSSHFITNTTLTTTNSTIITNTTTSIPHPPMRYKCGRYKPFIYFERRVRPWIVFSLVSLLPFFLLVMCNGLIIWTLQKRKKLCTKATIAQTTKDSPFSSTQHSSSSSNHRFLNDLQSKVVKLFHLKDVDSGFKNDGSLSGNKCSDVENTEGTCEKIRNKEDHKAEPLVSQPLCHTNPDLCLPLPATTIAPSALRHPSGSTFSSPPTHSPSAHSPPTHSPPAHFPPTHSQPAHSPPTHSQPAHSQPAHSPPAHFPPTHSQPAHSHPTHSQPVHSPPAHSQPAHFPPTHSQPAHSQPVHSPPASSHTTMATQSTYKQTTLMCMGVSVAFLLCVIPSIVMLIGKPRWSKNADGTQNELYEVFKAINNQLAYLNHSINFFLYCLTGGRFRSELVSMVKSWVAVKCRCGLCHYGSS